jgi:DNA-binding transcriptional regulator YiaG
VTPHELKAARHQLGLTQHQLAALLDADPRTVRRWENDERAIPGSVGILVRLLCLMPDALELVSNWAKERSRA